MDMEVNRVQQHHGCDDPGAVAPSLSPSNGSQEASGEREMREQGGEE
jgi:hypothetical protein